MIFNPNAVMNLEDQPNVFLGSVWQSLPNEGLVGLSYNTKYTNKQGEQLGTYSQIWQYASERNQINWYEVGQAFNENLDYQKQGLGSIYYNFSSRVTAMLNRTSDPRIVRGKYDELIAVGMFGGDLDCDKLGYDVGQAFDEIMRCPLPPSAVVHSGGGLQPVWFFKEAWMIRDQSSAYEYKKYSRGFMEWAAKYTQVHPDYSVNEPTRVLRLPGFRNNKLERKGAYAFLLHYDPDLLYSIEELKANVILPTYVSEPKRYTTSESNIFAVSRYLVDHLVYQTPPKGGDRHPTLRNIASFAASANIPQEIATPPIRKLAKVWFSEDVSRADAEVDKLIKWAYDNAEDMNFDQGGDYAIKIQGDSVEVVTDQKLDEQKRGERIVKLDTPPELPLRKTLEVVREEQDRFIEDYLRKKYKRGYPTLAVVRSSPGAGKTTAAIRISYKLIVEALEAGLEPPKVLYLTQFKMDNFTGRAWAREMGIDPDAYPNLFGFFYGRTNEDTPGNCANFDLAKSLGGKGYNVVKHLCNFCPFKAKCVEKGYLSQFTALQDKLFVVARYQQGMIEELQKGRKIIIIDESTMDIIGREIKVTLNDMSLRKIDPVTYDQHKAEVELSEKFLAALRAVMTMNKGQDQQLDGYWLMDNLIKQLGKATFIDAMNLDKRIVEGLQAVDTSSVSAIAQSQPKFMRELWSILRYDYEVFYSQGALKWNSRAIPFGMNLHLHPMEAFSFPADAKVLCLDATSMPQYYDLVITDRHVETIDGTKYKAPRPRHTITYDVKLAIKGVTTQFIGSENTRSTYVHPKTLAKLKESGEQLLEFIDPVVDLSVLDEPEKVNSLSFKPYYRMSNQRIIEELRKQHLYAHAQLIAMIEELAIRHDGSLLVVSYKGLSNLPFIREWVKRSKLIPEENLQWFGNLRGKNDWKNIRAVLIVGTPRIREKAMLAQASVFHYQDLTPLDTTRKWRIAAYPQDTPLQIGKDVGYFGYRYYGYADDRLDRWFLHSVVSEIIQAYDRVRSNSSIDTKNIYLATAIPSSEHVSAFRYWNSGNTAVLVHSLLKQEYEKSISDPSYSGYLISEMVTRIQELSNCSENHARDLYNVEFLTGSIDTEGTVINWSDHFGRVTTVGRTSRVSNRDSVESDSLPDKVMAWLKTNPARVGSGETMAKWYSLDNPLEKQPSKPTMLEGRKRYTDWLKSMASQANNAKFVN